MSKTEAKKYWKAVALLNEIINAGQESHEEIIEELKNDLNKFMPIEIVTGKWREEIKTERIICQIKDDGIHIQKITDLSEGRIIDHKDGAEIESEELAVKRDKLCEKVHKAMLPLGDVPKGVSNGKGWLQHDLEKVNQAKDDILEICREDGLGKSFEVFNNPGRKCHALSIIGRILDDTGGPIATAWNRFCRIDEKGMEHQQPFYAYTNGPLAEHVCIESRI